MVFRRPETLSSFFDTHQYFESWKGKYFKEQEGVIMEAIRIFLTYYQSLCLGRYGMKLGLVAGLSRKAESYRI